MSTVLVPSWNSLVGMVKVGAELAEGGSVRLQEICVTGMAILAR